MSAAGRAALGPLSVGFSVPERFRDAAGGLEHRPSSERPENAVWHVEEGTPGEPPEAHDAFYGDARLVVEGDALRVWSPRIDLRVKRASVRGVVSGPAVRLEASLALHGLAAHAGLFHVHAALVRLDGRTLLAPGPTGAGKTSLALAVAASGGTLLSDDTSYVTYGERVLGVRRPPHAAPATREAHAVLRSLGPVRDGTHTKVALEVPGAPASEALCPVDALVFPALDPGGVTRAERVDPPDAFAALLAASMLLPVPGTPAREAGLDGLALLAAKPAVVLRAGPDALARPALLVETLRRALS